MAEAWLATGWHQPTASTRHKPGLAARALVCGILVLGLPVGARAEEPAFQPTRFSFEPFLTTDHEPAVCGPFLAVAREAFHGPDFRIEFADRAWPRVETKWVFSPAQNADDRSGWNEELGSNIISHPADLDGDGMPEILTLLNRAHSWRGDQYTLLRHVDESLPAEFLRRTEPSESDAIYRVETARLQGSSWAVPRVVELGGAYYLVDAGEVWTDSVPVALYRIPASGKLPLICEVSIHPNPDQPLGPLGTTPMADLVTFLRRVAGAEGNCGTLRANARQANEAARVTARIAFRPWALRGEPYNNRTAVDAYLDIWSRGSLWNFRLHRQIPERESAAVSALSRYYRDAFGVPPETAQAEAIRVVDQILRRHFIFPESPQPPFEREYATSHLERLALAGGPAAAIASILTEEPGLVTEPTMLGWGLPREAPIFFALEHPNVLRQLLDVGAQVNVANHFGKTPLMYAAQFNLIETARLLVERGADPNTRTSVHPAWDCDAAIDFGTRSALMYAAENASVEMIRLLLSVGADLSARDSRGRGIADYLARNSGLSAAERAAAGKLLEIL